MINLLGHVADFASITINVITCYCRNALAWLLRSEEPTSDIRVSMGIADDLLNNVVSLDAVFIVGISFVFELTVAARKKLKS